MINYIPNHLKNISNGIKDKIYDSKTNKFVLGGGNKISKSKIKKESKGDINENIRNFFKLKKRAIKDKIISDIRHLFEIENKDYYKTIRGSNTYSNNYMKYEIIGDRDYKTYQLKNILIKLNYIKKIF